jgi:curli biogenesis system outer membrane secretion channel CsgG
VAVTGTNLIVAHKKTLTAEVVVDVRWVHVETSEVVFAESGRGVAEKTASGSLIVGGSMSYDPGLIGDALRAAIQEMLDTMIDSTEE